MPNRRGTFFFYDTAPSDIYTLSLHDALPISPGFSTFAGPGTGELSSTEFARRQPAALRPRSEEHTSELQSLRHIVCRLLLEKKNCKKLTRHLLPSGSSRPLARRCRNNRRRTR